MNSTIAIVTGASRGLGKALALQLMDRHIPLITVARHNNADLDSKAAEMHSPLTQLLADLSVPEAAQQASEKIAALIPRNTTRCILINNAGTVQPISKTTGLSDAGAINRALTLNVTALMLICTAVLGARTQAGIDDCRILNISSGAGRNAMPGWGVYCATKAAVDMYTQVLAQEHQNVRAVSLAPGVIDTEMQKSIRSSDAQDFPSVERFSDLHKHGQLASPHDTARHIIQYIDRDDFGTTVLDDIRHYS